jgi:ADP-dependent phosphofructokinase/glucokinase
MYSSFLNKLKDLENVNIFTELDTRISNKEIINAIIKQFTKWINNISLSKLQHFI